MKGAEIMTEQDRFDSHIVYAPNGCHVWMGAYRRGGKLDLPCFATDDGKAVYARRYAYRRLYALKPGHKVINVCGDKRCVNAYHMEAGDAYDVARVRRLRGGYLRRKGSTKRVTTADENRITAFRDMGVAVPDIARHTGFCPRTVQYVLSRKREAAEMEANRKATLAVMEPVISDLFGDWP